MRSGALVAGKYRLVKELGAGGMGSVWQAAHVVTERDFAIKFLHASCASSPSLLARFFQEAKVSGKLRHPSVIEIFDVGTEPTLDGAPYLVMELLDGASLDVLMRQVGPLPPRLVLESMLEVTRALALAHDKGIVHRDLKPANIFLHRPGTGALVPKVLDFGISKFAGANAPDVSTGLTQTGAVLGSPLYMSPEQAASDKTIDGRSDIHALGVVLWECLVGQAPFSADTYNNLVVQIITGERPRLAGAMLGAPPAIVAVVERAMARRREDRYQTAGELAEAIEAAIATLPPGTSIGARTAAAELFGRIPPSSLRSAAAASERPAVDASTTGGVAVPSQRMPANVSPAAFTMPRPSDAQHSTGPAAYAETQEARAPALAATVPEPAATLPVSTTASRQSVVRVGAVAGAAVLALAAVVVTVVLRPSSSRVAAPAAAASGASLDPIASDPTPIPSTAAVASPSAAASAPPPSPHPVHAASAAPVHAPVPVSGAPRPTAPRKPKDSVQSSGF